MNAARALREEWNECVPLGRAMRDLTAELARAAGIMALAARPKNWASWGDMARRKSEAEKAFEAMPLDIQKDLARRMDIDRHSKGEKIMTARLRHAQEVLFEIAPMNQPAQACRIAFQNYIGGLRRMDPDLRRAVETMDFLPFETASFRESRMRDAAPPQENSLT